MLAASWIILICSAVSLGDWELLFSSSYKTHKIRISEIESIYQETDPLSTSQKYIIVVVQDGSEDFSFDVC